MNHPFTQALVRSPSRNFAKGLTTAAGPPPEYRLMLRQHQEYIETLRRLGLEVTVLSPLDDHPDAHFVEDAAVITPRLAVMTRPGAPQRRGEADPLEPEVARWRKTERLQSPATLDGGDVLETGRRLFVGISRRTNQQGARQLGRLLAPQGYSWCTVPVSEGLHLKSSVSYLGRDTLLLTPTFAKLPEFEPFQRIVVDPGEKAAANVLAVNGKVVVPSGFPRTRQAIESRGFETLEVDASEARKMDGGLTCMALLF